MIARSNFRWSRWAWLIALLLVLPWLLAPALTELAGARHARELGGLSLGPGVTAVHQERDLASAKGNCALLAGLALDSDLDPETLEERLAALEIEGGVLLWEEAGGVAVSPLGLGRTRHRRPLALPQFGADFGPLAERLLDAPADAANAASTGRRRYALVSVRTSATRFDLRCY